MIYEVSYDGERIARVEILDGSTSRLAIKEMVEFWMGWEKSLADSGGSYVECWLRKLVLHILTHGHPPSAHDEGWYPLEGSKHIWLRDFWPWQFDPGQIQIDPEPIG